MFSWEVHHAHVTSLGREKWAGFSAWGWLSEITDWELPLNQFLQTSEKFCPQGTQQNAHLLTVVFCLSCVSPILVWLSLGPEASTSPGLRWVLSLVWIWLSWNLASSSASSLNSRLINSPWESFASGCTLVSKGKTEAKGLGTGILLFLNVMVTLVFSIVSFPDAHLGQITSYLFTVSLINLGPLFYLFNPLSRSLR